MRNSNPFLDIFIILVGLFFIGHDLYKDKVSSTSDLKEINGTIQNYSFIENRGLKNHTYSYYIYLNEYLTGFQISADFVDWFDKAKFEKTVKQGDSLRVFISKYDYAKIGSIEKAFAFGIDSKTKEFLNPDNVIREYNSETALVFGLVFITAGMILLYFDVKRRKKRKLETEKTNRRTNNNNNNNCNGTI